MRKMATIERIAEIRPIPDANAIECAVVKGWTVVVKKGDFSVGNLAIFCEIDSWIPHELAPFLSKGKTPRVYEGVSGERLRTVKLRKQLSQGLLLPFTLLSDGHNEGDDVSEILNIVKYETPIPSELAGQAAGNFPSWIPKTDQERVQNLKMDILKYQGPWLIEEKLEGSSMTAWYDSTAEEQFGVCSRNWSLKLDQSGNAFVDAYHDNNLEDLLRSLAKEFVQPRIAVQGELVGNKIQGNIYQIPKNQFYIYNIILDDGSNMPHQIRRDALGKYQVPLLGEHHVGADTINGWLEMSEGESRLYPTEREGIVVKSLSEPQVTFKVISNRYLLSEK